MQIARILVVLLLLAGFSGRVYADEAPSPDALQAATELMKIMSPDMMNQLVTQVTGAVWPAVERNARARNIDDATIADLRKEFERIETGFVSDAMKDAPAIYARHFTAAELRDLIAFYRTPTGAKALRQLPVVMGEFNAEMLPKLSSLNSQVSAAFSEILRAHGYVK